MSPSRRRPRRRAGCSAPGRTARWSACPCRASARFSSRICASSVSRTSSTSLSAVGLAGHGQRGRSGRASAPGPPASRDGAPSRPPRSTMSSAITAAVAGSLSRRLRRRPRAPPVVGADDAAHERVAHHVASVKRDTADALDAVAGCAIASTRPDFWPGGRSIWRRVAGDDHARALAEAGQEHLHLHRRGVLRLVEDDEGVGQRAAAHEGERRDLDHAGLQAALDLVAPACMSFSAS